ncbi:MAG: GGDEF domain-containing protein [Myxococcota bacterium]
MAKSRFIGRSDWVKGGKEMVVDLSRTTEIDPAEAAWGCASRLLAQRTPEDVASEIAYFVEQNLPVMLVGVCWQQHGKLQVAVRSELNEASVRSLLKDWSTEILGTTYEIEFVERPTLGSAESASYDLTLSERIAFKSLGRHPGLNEYLLWIPKEDGARETPRWLAAATKLFGSALLHSREFAVLERHANTDALTGVLNRRGFDRALMRECALSDRRDASLAVLLIDLDHFKEINDSLGHSVGDLVLVEAAQRMRVELRAADVIGRMGGDEFAILLPECDTDAAIQVAERVLEAVRQMDVGGATGLTASLGIAATGQVDPTADALLEAADHAMYRAKSDGRDRFCVWQGCEPVGSAVHRVAAPS